MKCILAPAFLLLSVIAFSQADDSVMNKKITDQIPLNGSAHAPHPVIF